MHVPDPRRWPAAASRYRASRVHWRGTRQGRPEVQLVFLAVGLAVLHAPVLATSRGHLQVESSSVGELVGLFLGFAFLICSWVSGVTSLGISGASCQRELRRSPQTSPQGCWTTGDLAGQHRQQKTRCLYENSGFLDVPKHSGTVSWRRRWDSNPRYGYKPYASLAGMCLRPLGHVSNQLQQCCSLSLSAGILNAALGLVKEAQTLF
jgi:hypothetical protein